jgi:pimeloyl-ACP methyl ester carboxylesterase
LIELTDLLATVSGLIGVPLPAGAGPDSKDFTSLLDGGQTPVRKLAIHHSLRGHFAIRSGAWKLIEKRGSGGFSTPRSIEPKVGEPKGQLYHLGNDPSETNNLWASEPAVVERLSLLLGDSVAPLERQRIRFESSADGTQQEAILITPGTISNEPRPMVVNLHSWSADLHQRSALERRVYDRGWFYLFPNFRGANQTPQACGSPLAQQDVLDAVDWMLAHHAVDPQRIYLTGASGGGHMTMLMAGRYPRRWKAASAWVGISDLVSWHQKHRGSRYGNMIEACCGGLPGDSPEVDQQYHDRSPIHFITAARNLPIDLLAGADDGHTGSVPIRHSIDAFNKIAEANGTPAVTEQEIQQLSQRGGRLRRPKDGDVGFDPRLGRDHFLRRHSGSARLTIFDGGHESIAEATMVWFEQHP